MKLNEAVSLRVSELLEYNAMTQYQLHLQTGIPKSTISNIINCSYNSVKLRVINEVCQGFNITLCEFFDSELFQIAAVDDD